MPTPGTDTSRPEVEYEQDIVKANAQQKFEGLLNRRARQGWKAMHIAQTDTHFLVTHIRTLPQTRQTDYETTVSNGPARLAEDLNEMIMQGFALHHFSSIISPMTANHGLSHNLVYTCVWRRSRHV